jgi:trigger factor
VRDVHFHSGQDLHFKADYEVAPVFELGEYRGLEAPYSEPVVAESDIDTRLEALRDRKADYINLDPRPIVAGDHVAATLNSKSGIEGEPIASDETVFHVGSPETMPEFTRALVGSSPGDVLDVDVEYPADYSNPQVAGRKVSFEIKVKAVRRKELPELNDEFAKDLGDYQGLDELRAAIRRDLVREQEGENRRTAQDAIVQQLVASHDFPLPTAWVEGQITAAIDSQFSRMGVTPEARSKLDVNWAHLRHTMRGSAEREVRASLLITRIAERESIEVMTDEVDREVTRIARQRREPVAATRKKLEDQGVVAEIAHRIRTGKVLNFLFENAKKVAPQE